VAAGPHLKPFTFFLTKPEHAFVKAVAKQKKISAAKVMRHLVQKLAKSPANKTLGARVRQQDIS
jgi:hypothetical protein